MDSKDKKPDSSSSAEPPDTMTLHQLKDMLSKGVEPSDTEERLNQLVHWRIQEYTTHKWKALSDIFAEEFEQFAKEDFEKLTKDNIYSLRDCLRINGVYVQKGRGISIAQALANVVQEDIPWPSDDDEEERPPPKQQQHYPPQQQPYQQPYRPENTVPLPPQQPVQPQQPYQPIVEDTTPVHPPPTPIVEDITPVHPSPTPSDGPPHQPQQQPEDTTTLFPPTTNCGPDYRVPHLLPSPYQVIQDFEIKEQAVAEDSLKSTTKKSITSSNPVNTSQLSAVSRPRTISTLREPTFSLSTARIQHTPNLAPPFASQHAHFLAPLFASQHAHFLASWLASPLGYIRDTEKRKAIGQG